MVIASQIIHSSTEVYYLNRSLNYGMQAAQIVSTELRGEIEDALPLVLYDADKKDYRKDEDKCYIFISDGSDEKYIEFIESNGKQIKFTFENKNGSWVLNKYSLAAYDERTLKAKSSDNTTNSINYDFEKVYDSKYIGMGYEVHDIKIDKFVPVNLAEGQTWSEKNEPQELEIGNYPVLVLTIKVGNNQYDEYECVEYIPLYNFYGIIDDSSEISGGTSFEDIIKIE